MELSLGLPGQTVWGLSWPGDQPYVYPEGSGVSGFIDPAGDACRGAAP